MELKPVEMTIKEKVQRLLDGEVFYNEAGGKIYFDETVTDNPFRVGTSKMSLYWNRQWYQEGPWYDEIPEKGVICWVWNDPIIKFLRLIVRVVDDDCIIDCDDTCWTHAKPITHDEFSEMTVKECES